MRSLLTLFQKRSIFLFSFFTGLLGYQQLQAQDVPMTIKIVNSKNESVPFATIVMINRTDTTQSLNKVADSSGKADFRLKKGIQYLIRVSSINYQPFEKNITINGNQKNFVFTLEPLPKTLNTVTITSSKPLMRQEDDKTIIDPRTW